ncbi:YidC/Oxa1 family membrane protein insertase [Helicobacter labetoulli]|uniref:YidC/Oxa1 family membrane protein insertase n=1 Tax=Helicobacter labetoulli TaxID=2315333 RepID=UPI001FC9C3CE|nr:membrane protein insertase YidC [Helicobacter labetoulli]
MIAELLHYVFIFPLEQVLEVVLHNILKVIPSYGVSIILLSLVVNLFLLKIFLYTDKKAQQEADLKEKLDKRIKSWKSMYKRAKLYAFTQALYRQHKYHPIYALRSLGGLMLQIPFFIAMIHLIENAEYLQNVSFLWIDDLSKPDSIMLFGFSIHILPLLMSAFTLINVFYSSKELGARVQGSLIALLFLVLLYNMPSALVLYWTCNMGFALLKAVLSVRGSRLLAKMPEL